MTYFIIISNSNLFKNIWEVKFPPNAQVLAWRALLDILPFKINLIRRWVNIVESLYSLCHLCQEFVQHLFLKCKVASSA